jgi:hypothetical protein
MPRANNEKPRWYQAKLAFVWVQGAKPVEYQKAIVRDRHTGKLAEIDLHEYPPIDEGSEGVARAFAKGERVPSDDPVVAAKPSYFMPAEELVLAERK